MNLSLSIRLILGLLFSLSLLSDNLMGDIIVHDEAKAENVESTKAAEPKPTNFILASTKKTVEPEPTSVELNPVLPYAHEDILSIKSQLEGNFDNRSELPASDRTKLPTRESVSSDPSAFRILAVVFVITFLTRRRSAK